MLIATDMTQTRQQQLRHIPWSLSLIQHRPTSHDSFYRAATGTDEARRLVQSILHPDTVSDYWAAACAKAGVTRIRLHDARHTCGTLMHLEHNVPVAVISAWLGHADTAFTMRTYVHNQPEKLALAAESISSWTRRTKSAQ